MREKERERKNCWRPIRRGRGKKTRVFNARARNNFSWDAGNARHKAAHFKHLS